MDRVTQSRIEFTINHLNENVFRFSKTKDGKIVYTLNEGPIPRQLNLQTDVVFGKTVEEVVGKDQAAKVMPLILDAFEGKTTSYELDMGEFIFQTVLSPVEEDGKINEVSGTSYDITEKRKSLKALQEAHDKLKEANEEKNLLFSIIAHDLKSPVGTMAELLKIIQEESKKQDNQHLLEIATECNKTAQDSLTLLENLFDWAKCQLDQSYFNPKAFDVVAVIKAVISLFNAATKEKNIRITLSGKKPVIIFADFYYINTIFRNLIGNAIKFSHPGDFISINIEDNKDETKFSVVDKGIGVEPSRIDKIFSIYQSKSTPGTAGERGTGLGLSLCAQFVKRHNGNIGLQSVVDEGSEFWFTIPKIKTENQE